MIYLSRRALPGRPERPVRHVADMNERPQRPPATVKRQPASDFHKQDRARDDPIQLLSRSIDVRGPGEHDWKMVVPKERCQMQITCRSRCRVGSARIEWRAFSYVAAATPVNLRRRDVHVFIEKTESTDFFMQSHVGDHVGLVPVLGMKPTLGDHALSREIDHVIRREFLNRAGNPVSVPVQITWLEPKPPQA